MHSDKVSTSVGESRNRKSTKPIMEKRRRARINASLAELKSLLLEVIKREGARYSKMEKADILEMTVKHLREMQRQSFSAIEADNPTTSNKYALGFSECTQEVSKYLSNIDGNDVELRTRLLEHLANFISGTESTGSPSSPVTPHPVTSSTSPSPLPVNNDHHPIVSSSTMQQSFLPNIVHTTQSVKDLNNNTPAVSASPQPVQPTKVVSGLQVIPTKLQSGEIAFVLPGNVQGGTNVPNYIIPVYTPPDASQVKPNLTVTTGVATPGSYMAIVPSADVLQACTLTPGNINVISQPSSSPVTMSSPVPVLSSVSMSSPASYPCSFSLSPRSTSDSSVVSISPLLGSGGHDIRDLRELHHHDVREFGNIYHPRNGTKEMWRPW